MSLQECRFRNINFRITSTTKPDLQGELRNPMPSDPISPSLYFTTLFRFVCCPFLYRSDPHVSSSNIDDQTRSPRRTQKSNSFRSNRPLAILYNTLSICCCPFLYRSDPHVSSRRSISKTYFSNNIDDQTRSPRRTQKSNSFRSNKPLAILYNTLSTFLLPLHL